MGDLNKYKKLLWSMGVAVLLAMILFTGCQSDEKSESAPASAATNTKAAATTAESTDVDMTAFIKEFDASETSALRKYKGEYVQLDGYVNKFKAASAAGTFAVIVATQEAGNDAADPYPGTAIECLFNKADIPMLTKGESVTVKGQVDDMAMDRISLKNCSVVK
ncbi:MAG: OB-fold putative lipoprotein [Actinobacteria bacterium]|nr:OB-fold putative lipoprotein [Actinomycetota bacterium]